MNRTVMVVLLLLGQSTARAETSVFVEVHGISNTEQFERVITAQKPQLARCRRVAAPPLSVTIKLLLGVDGRVRGAGCEDRGCPLEPGGWRGSGWSYPPPPEHGWRSPR